MAEREPLPPKKDIARALLLRGSIFVYLDPRRHGVRVPLDLAQHPQLVLQVGLDLPVPIPDLRVDDLGVFGTLSFRRTPFTCAIPWEAVFALVGDDGMFMVWPDDMPGEVADEVDQAARNAPREPRATRKAGPRLRAVEGGAAESGEMPARSADGATNDADETSRKRPSYLRVVK